MHAEDRIAENHITVSRAATAIYLILAHLNRPGDDVIVPGNLCYAGIYPVLYADMHPVFCDVDPVSGNTDLKRFSAALTPQTKVAIIPHMYGNPVQDFPQIASLCKIRGILLIEDCASAMGITPASYKAGELSDYCVFSTGYSKTLDLGMGGILASATQDLSSLASLEVELPQCPADLADALAYFSRQYRKLRNTNQETPEAQAYFRKLPQQYRKYFVYRMENRDRIFVENRLKELPSVVVARNQAKELYDRLLFADATPQNPAASDTWSEDDIDAKLADNGLMRYPFAEGAVPWRYNLRAEPVLRQKLIDSCLQQELPISDWYPSVQPMFGDQTELRGIRWHENHILNFPLLISEDIIDEICKIIISCTKK